LLWIAIGTGWLVAWLAFALTSLMPTLILMVIAQTPGLPVARFMHDPDLTGRALPGPSNQRQGRSGG
jgi:hypothetical protein